MSMQALIESVTAEQSALQARQALLGSLASALPPLVAEAVTNVRRNAAEEVVLVLDGRHIGLKAAFDSLPAEKSFAAISGSFDRPAAIDVLSESEMREDRRHPLFWPAFPVTQRRSSVLGTSYAWKTQVRNSPVDVELFHDDDSYWGAVMSEGQLVTTGSSSVLVQPLAVVECRELETQDRAWNDEWEAFKKAEDFSLRQERFVSAFKAAANRRVVLSLDDLPVPVARTMPVAGEDLVILQSGFPVEETWSDHSQIRHFSRIGNFWGSFTREQAKRLVEFQAKMARKLLHMESAYSETMAVLEKAKRSLAQFNRDTVGTYRGKPPAALLSAILQAEFGYPIQVSYRDMVRPFGDGNFQEVWLYLDRCNLGSEVRFKATFEKGDKLWFEAPFTKLQSVSFLA